MENKHIILKKGKEESLLRFHPWVFSGAILRAEGDIEEGDLVTVFDHERGFLAKGHSQIGSITVRVLTFTDETVEEAWWAGRIAHAYEYRQRLGLTNSPDTNCYRLVHGEGDFLPGLIVDLRHHGGDAVPFDGDVPRTGKDQGCPHLRVRGTDHGRIR